MLLRDQTINLAAELLFTIQWDSKKSCIFVLFAILIVQLDMFEKHNLASITTIKSPQWI